MANGNVGAAAGNGAAQAGGGVVGANGQPDFAKMEENRKKDLETQLIMQEIQRKTTAQNTTMTALSTLQKGNDDVLRSIANSLK